MENSSIKRILKLLGFASLPLSKALSKGRGLSEGKINRAKQLLTFHPNLLSALLLN
jgi:hypothetical protein